MIGAQRNTDTCPIYINDVAPFLCIQTCFTMRDGPWCVTNCSVTGKKYIPEKGLDCLSLCPYFYQYQIIYGIEQPRCIQNCNYMRSTAEVLECQPICHSNISLYINGITFCSNCTQLNQLQVTATMKFSCIQQKQCSEQMFNIENVCSFTKCYQTQLQQVGKGYICEEQFNFNYTTLHYNITNSKFNVTKVQVTDQFAHVLFQNGSVIKIDNLGVSSVVSNNTEYISQIAVPPLFNSLKLLLQFKNGSYINENVNERTDFTNETTKTIIGFFDNENTDLSINYLLTNQNLYFRGSCKAGLCTKDQNGNDFDTLFKGKTKFRSMWTKMNLAAAGFPFSVSDVRDIQEQNWAMLFTLNNNQKYLFGLNKFGRLCQDLTQQVALINVTNFDVIHVGQFTTLMSQDQELYTCGATFGVDEVDLTNMNLLPTKIQISGDSYLGWGFVNRTILSISSANSGFLIRTASEVYGLGRCVAFQCYDFSNQYILYSNNVRRLKWSTQSMHVIGNSMSIAQYSFQPVAPIHVNDTRQYSVDFNLNQSGTLDFLNQQQSPGSKSWPLLIGIFLALDLIAFLGIKALVKVMKKHQQSRNALVQTYIKVEMEFPVMEPVNNENVERNALITHNISMLNDFEFE
ncbi:Regulator_of chromosome condensation 1/beta-lactamase-inhibitor protein II [Hexamita inflata]|uniref:Regulator of chromosome condensation 1/beta-lactamase-inhibitor protein II n=1 Tax=Hexamita inflata TaxID=28002 RepID=A0AA86UIL3_9EUKA|nr:Regulator of chromosome condensation 1/beta-lactamase-inhibitor protein II [Hexamita inflata]CAI9974635.1 Regulator of chromosome condensation 1/beta-lactamase-inhibitor protein II [Hexamita inflata]